MVVRTIESVPISMISCTMKNIVYEHGTLADYYARHRLKRLCNFLENKIRGLEFSCVPNRMMDEKDHRSCALNVAIGLSNGATVHCDRNMERLSICYNITLSYQYNTLYKKQFVECSLNNNIAVICCS